MHKTAKQMLDSEPMEIGTIVIGPEGVQLIEAHRSFRDGDSEPITGDWDGIKIGGVYRSCDDITDSNIAD